MPEEGSITKKWYGKSKQDQFLSLWTTKLHPKRCKRQQSKSSLIVESNWQYEWKINNNGEKRLSRSYHSKNIILSQKTMHDLEIKTDLSLKNKDN
jgi:hypothetical protein